MRRTIFSMLFSLLLMTAACGNEQIPQAENPDTPFIRADMLAMTHFFDSNFNFSVDLPLPRGIQSADLDFVPGDITIEADDAAFYQVILAEVGIQGKSMICQDTTSDACIKATFDSDTWQYEAYTITVFNHNSDKPKGFAEDCPNEVDPFNTMVINNKKRRYASCIMTDGARLLSVVIHQEDRFFMLTARGSRGRMPTYAADFFQSFGPA